MNQDCKTTEAKNPQVQQEMQRLHKEIAQVEENLNTLRVRIQGILDTRPTGPPRGEKVSGTHSLVQFADEIRNAREKVSRCNDDIMDMLNTCEL